MHGTGILGVIPNRSVSSVLVYGWTVISAWPYHMAEVSLDSDIAGTDYLDMIDIVEAFKSQVPENLADLE